MSVIYKYAMAPGRNEVSLPLGAKFLHAAEQDLRQNGMFYAWFLVDPDIGHDEEKVFEVVATGERFSASEKEHLATVLCAGGKLVWHLFEVYVE